MKQEIFGMRRANGDWFVMDVAGETRVLLFRDLASAWRARAANAELMLFWPAPVDDRAMVEFGKGEDGRPVSFWLLDEENQANDLKQGHPLEYMQLAALERPNDLPMRARARGQAAGERAWM